MANLVIVRIRSLTLKYSSAHDFNWTDEGGNNKEVEVPHIFFSSGEPWLAVNEYALECCGLIRGNNPKTILSNLSHLKAYADWLEAMNVDWKHFPVKRKERCVFRYRGYLIEQRDLDELSSNTASARMSAVLRFYRWAQNSKLLHESPLWKDSTYALSFFTPTGFSRTIEIKRSELSIPNNKTRGVTLENGLLPVSDENQEILLKFLCTNCSKEMFLMHVIGFLTGARSETIRTLTRSGIENAVEDPTIQKFMRVQVGPGTQIKTKFNVKGHLLFPRFLIEALLSYSSSIPTLSRTAKAGIKSRNLLFLTQHGNPYSETTFTKLVSDLRRDLFEAGLGQFQSFKFHQTRATFGTRLMRIALSIFPKQSDSIIFVRDAMHHKHESTTWKYVRFTNQELLQESLGGEFFNLFTGISLDIQALLAK